MKRILLKSLVLLCALVVGSMNVWATDATFNWASGGNMGSNATGKVGNITLTGAANSASNAPAVTSNTLRLYAHRSSGNGSSATFTADAGYKISAIEVTSSNGGTILKYATDGGSSFSVFSFSEGVATVSGLDVSSITLKNCQNSGSNNTTIQISKVIITYSSSGSTPSSDVSFEYSARSFDLKDASSFTQAATTADGYSSKQGASVTYSIGATNTANATINATTGEVTPKQAGSVVVEAAAAAVDGYLASNASYTLTVTDTRVWTVTCHIGNNTSNVNRTSGATLSLDDPAEICGMSFVGWSSTDNAVSPTWVANNTAVTANRVLYAIFEAVAAEHSYRLVESNQSDWRGDYLIAYDSETFANGKVSGTSGIGDASTVKDPNDKLSGKVVDVTWGDEYHVTLEAIDDEDLSKGYLLKTQDGYYNYHTNNSGNGINGTSQNKVTASGYPLTINYVSSSEINITLDKGQVFRFNTSQGYFRYYKSASYADQGKVYLYKRTEDIAPVYSLGITEEITIGASKYATYCSTQALCFATTDVKAYKAKVTDNKVVLTKVDAVPANEGVILFCDVAGDYDIPVIPAAAAVTENELIGVNTKTKIAYDGAGSKKNYILANGASGVGFYKASTTGANLAAHKAYLSTENAVTAREFLGFGEETTGVADVRGKIEDGICDFFDLQGRKVAQPTKGLYIVNGKKVIIK